MPSVLDTLVEIAGRLMYARWVETTSRPDAPPGIEWSYERDEGVLAIHATVHEESPRLHFAGGQRGSISLRCRHRRENGPDLVEHVQLYPVRDPISGSVIGGAIRLVAGVIAAAVTYPSPEAPEEASKPLSETAYVRPEGIEQ